MLSLVRNKVGCFLSEMSEESFSYLVSIIIFFVFSVASKLLGDSFSKYLFWLPLLILIYGFFRFLIEKLKLLLASLVGKAIVSILLFVGSTVCLTYAKLIINSTLEVPASPFFYTQSILAILVSPLFISITLGISLIFVLPIAMVLFFRGETEFSLKQVLLFWHSEGVSISNPLVGLSRFIALIAIMSICWSFNSKNGWYASPLQDFTKWYAYNLETEIFSHCKLAKDERIAYVNKDDIVVAKKIGGSYIFVMANCERKL